MAGAAGLALEMEEDRLHLRGPKMQAAAGPRKAPEAPGVAWPPTPSPQLSDSDSLVTV